jgi:hypothetical protein
MNLPQGRYRFQRDSRTQVSEDQRLVQPNVYGFTRRGLTARRLTPWGIQVADNVPARNIILRNGVIATANVSQLVSDKPNRSYFEFQNQSDTDMMVNFAAVASANVGVLIPAGGSRIWDALSMVGEVTDNVFVFCTAAGKAFSFAEAGA